MRFKKYLIESVTSYKNPIDGIKEAIKLSKNMRLSFVLWRGFKTREWIFKVGMNDKNLYRGGNNSQNLELDVFKHIGIKPIFCFASYPASRFFGSVHAVIPVGKYDVLQSNEISDIGIYLNKEITNIIGKIPWTIQQINSMNIHKTIANLNYPSISDVLLSKNVNDKLKKDVMIYIVETYDKIISPKNWEVMLSAKEYLMINVDHLIRLNRSKFNDYKKPDQIKTYKDLDGLLTSYLDFYNWKQKNR